MKTSTKLYFRGTILVKNYGENFDSDLFCRNEVREVLIQTLKNNEYSRKPCIGTTIKGETVLPVGPIGYPIHAFNIEYEGSCTDFHDYDCEESSILRYAKSRLMGTIMNAFIEHNIFETQTGTYIKIYIDEEKFEEERNMGPENSKIYSYDTDLVDGTGKLSPVNEVWVVERQERWSQDVDDDECERYDHVKEIVDIFNSKDKAVECILDNVKRIMEQHNYGNNIMQPPTLEQVKESYEPRLPKCSYIPTTRISTHTIYSSPIYAYSRAEYGDYIRFRMYNKEIK